MRKSVKNPQFILAQVIALVLTVSCSTAQITDHKIAPSRLLAQETTEDSFLWLESTSSPQALDWVKSENSRSLHQLTSDNRFESVKKNIENIILAPDRIPTPSAIMGNWVYNFWQDKDHVRGLWRRTSLENYKTDSPYWETLLDIDKLALAENENWVYKSSDCLAPKNTNCLISLSRGGGDAVVIREFNLVKKAFVSDGFNIPEAKTDAAWLDENTLLVGTNWGEGSLTTSSYPRIVKKWHRGTELKEAKTVFEGSVNDISASPSPIHCPEGNETFIMEGLTFFTNKLYWIQNDKVELVPIPEDAIFQGLFKKQLLISLRTDWSLNGKLFSAGTLLSIPMKNLKQLEPEVLLAPDSHSSIQYVTRTANQLFIHVLENVNGKIFQAQKINSGWKLSALPLPAAGAVDFVTGGSFEHLFITSYVGFLTPASYFLHSDLEPLKKPEIIKQAKTRFNSDEMIVEQFESTSLDGTKIPYYLVHKKNLPLNGSNPTIMTAYGGFEVSETPYYSGTVGKVWLEAGGAYVLANIRGGGEFGPKWHNTVIKENRHKVFEDFASVAQSLIAKKITSPRRLGIKGGSNGGLLVGASLVLYPELFNAVSCEVPLLDMIRFPLLGAGTSWEGEYGDPADPIMKQVILQYSPYQNVKKDQKYPKVFFSTATTHDRVTPAHARKMAAKMEAQGHDILFYENTNGGHGAAANLQELIRDQALIMTYFFQQLFD